jgi:hypothetical protein
MLTLFGLQLRLVQQYIRGRAGLFAGVEHGRSLGRGEPAEAQAILPSVELVCKAHHVKNPDALSGASVAVQSNPGSVVGWRGRQYRAA